LRKCARLDPANQGPVPEQVNGCGVIRVQTDIYGESGFSEGHQERGCEHKVANARSEMDENFRAGLTHQ
jgi:hypothetical protein